MQFCDNCEIISSHLLSSTALSLSHVSWYHGNWCLPVSNARLKFEKMQGKQSWIFYLIFCTSLHKKYTKSVTWKNRSLPRDIVRWLFPGTEKKMQYFLDGMQMIIAHFPSFLFVYLQLIRVIIWYVNVYMREKIYGIGSSEWDSEKNIN